MLQALWISLCNDGFAPEKNNIFQARLINTLTTLFFIKFFLKYVLFMKAMNLNWMCRKINNSQEN